MKSYLENCDTNKHIIFTFSNILADNFEGTIHNKKYNNFSKNKIKIINVESIKSECKMDNEIDDFYNNNNYNLCIFNFNKEDLINLNHINYLIENKEKSFNYKNNITDKVILFIIHLKRNADLEEEDTKIREEYLISHLANIRQIFIDDLNGKDINLKKIFDSSNNELFNYTELINLDEEFNKNLYHAFSFISYNIKINLSNIKDNEYIEKVCEYINKNKFLKELIQKIIKNKIKNLDDNITKKIITDYNFEDNDVDFISVLCKKLKSLYSDIFIQAIIQIENENVLSTKLLGDKEMDIEIINNIFDKHFNNLKLDFGNNVSFSKTVKINSYFGISYPFIISNFNEINNYVNTILEDYKDNEYQCDNFKEYFSKKDMLENNIKKEFDKKYFSDIFKGNENNLNISKMYQILFNDYIIYYLSKSNDYLSNIKLFKLFYELFKLFLSRKENNELQNNNNFDNIYSIKTISKFVLFIESYRDIIYSVCSFLTSIDSYVNSFITDFIEIMSQNIFQKQNNDHAYANGIFFNIFESLVYCFFSIKEPFINFSDEILFDFLNKIQLFSNVIMKINIELGLALKNILFLSDFFIIKKAFVQNEIKLKENLNIYLNILQKEINLYLIPQFIKIEKINDNQNIIYEEFSFLKEKLSKIKEYHNIISRIFLNKIRISKDENYRINILNIIFSDNLFIINNKIIFDTLLNKYGICPEDKDKNDDYNENEDEENEINDDNNDNDGEVFLSELIENKNNVIINYLNEQNNECFDEILLSLYDGKLINYFKNKKNEEDKILNQSFQIFKKCIEYIEKEDCKIANNKLAILYCISFIKYYCYHLGKIIIEKTKSEIYDFFREIFDFLSEKSEGDQPKKFRKVIKIYILKIINLIFIKNYNNFIEEIEDKNIFFEDFDFEEKAQGFLDFLFINNENYDFYKDLRKNYIAYKVNNYQGNNEIIKMINNKDKNFICFYDLIINEEKSNFNLNTNIQLSHFLLDVINKLNISTITKKILLLFYDINQFKEKIPSIKDLGISDFEFLLYSHKLAVISSMSNHNSIHSKIFSSNLIENIKNLYLPGGEPNFSLKIKAYKEINDFLKIPIPDSSQFQYEKNGYGIYMCSCYSWYVVDRCTKPTEKFQCKRCAENIGGKSHVLEKREGHVRIIKDGEKVIFDGPKIYLSELKKEGEEEERLDIKGFKKVAYEFFKNPDKKVRNMHNVTYRILSFIFYSCLYYCEKIEYISKDDLNNFYFDDKFNKVNNILFILRKIWELLKNELGKIKIEKIQCFLNMIFPELSKLIIENEIAMNNNEEREKFEKLCNNIIINAIANYNNYYTIYKKNNNEILSIKDDSMKSILGENSDINNLSELDYPLYKYFRVSNYPNYLLFEEQFDLISDGEIKYPVLTNYIKAKEEGTIELLQNLNYINPFINYVLNKYSNKITRAEAKKIIIRDELENDKYMEKLFRNFQEGYQNISSKLTNYDCRGILDEKKIITEDDCLAYCLNDNIEIKNDYGIYIAAIYKVLITYQNEFLNGLIKNKNNNEYLYIYSEQIQKNIIIQKAKKNEIVSLDISNSQYDTFENLIYSFSYRNCFNEDGSFNDSNYKDNKFDFDSIEKELSNILLPGKRIFANEQEQEFMNYALEAFNQNECIILDFIEKIKEIQYLTYEQKIILSNILEKVDYNLILFNLQTLFLYFVRNKNIDGTEILIEEIDLLPNNIIKLDEKVFSVFKNSQFNIRLNQLVDCYEYIEQYNYDKILLNVSKSINNKLSEKQISELNKHFLSEENLLINKQDLGNAVRKYICRFLLGDRFKNVEQNIFCYLKLKKELWKEKINNEENQIQFQREIEELESINIIISQSIDFYEKLGIEAKHDKNKEKKIKRKKRKNNLDY